MAISDKLRERIKLAEMVIFEAWRTAPPDEQKRLVEKLGNWEAEKIIEEIREQAKKQK